MALTYVIDQPASQCTGNAIYIGPTAVDFSMLPERPSGQPRIPAGEREQMKRWRQRDRATLHGHYGPRYVDPKHPNRSF